MDFDIRSELRSLLVKDGNVFDGLVEKINTYYSRTVSDLAEMKKRDDKKEKGNLWESFCQLWLESSDKYSDVWLLKELPAEILEELKLPKNDIGIDIIARRKKGGYEAIQAKYRKFNPRSNKVPWKTLSTFVGATKDTGPWEDVYVMTNSDGISGKPKVIVIGRTIAVGTFRGTSRERWMKICGTYIEHRLGVAKTESPRKAIKGIDALRSARLKYFESK